MPGLDRTGPMGEGPVPDRGSAYPADRQAGHEDLGQGSLRDWDFASSEVEVTV